MDDVAQQAQPRPQFTGGKFLLLVAAGVLQQGAVVTQVVLLGAGQVGPAQGYLLVQVLVPGDDLAGLVPVVVGFLAELFTSYYGRDLEAYSVKQTTRR